MITIWHNPRCSKSRQTLALLQGKGDIILRRYLEDAPNAGEISAVLALLGGDIAQMMRTGEARFKELGLSVSDDAAILVTAMAANPILIERPIVLANGKAAVGRPPEAVLDIL